MMLREHQFEFKGELITTHYGRYDINSQLAVSYVNKAGETVATLTVCAPDLKLADGEILVKTWFENADLVVVAAASGYYKDTGKRELRGFSTAQVWRFADEG